MKAFKLTPFLTAALMVAAGLACRKPAPAPAPEPAKAETPAPAKVDTTVQKPVDDSKRKAEEAAEAARKAAAEAEAAYRKAAEAALLDIHFDYDKADVRSEDKPVLAGIADFMKNYPKANVFIDGNCDQRGTIEYNLALGERRAAAVRDYLVNLGVPAARLSTTSYGKEKLVCTESVEPCWFKNRRAHFSLK